MHADSHTRDTNRDAEANMSLRLGPAELHQTLDNSAVQIVMVGAAHGMDTSGYTIPYVASWASSEPGLSAGEVVQRTGERVRATAIKILDGLPTTQSGTGDPPGLHRAAALSGDVHEKATAVADRSPLPARVDSARIWGLA